MMVSSFHDVPSQGSAMPGALMHMAVPNQGLHHNTAEPTPNAGHNYQHQHSQHHQQQQTLRRKRKADSQDTHNERLSKRLSLLNLGMIDLSPPFTSTLTF
jgi:hypothetical protein